MAGPFPAPLECVEAVAAAVTQKFDEGLKTERELFLELVQTSESKALRHAFFAERAASKIPDVPEDTPKREIKSAAVIGAGTMGGGIAMNFANAGIPVKILEMKQEALDKGLATIRKNYENTMKKGKLTQEKFDQRVGLITGTLSLRGHRQCRHRGRSGVRGHGRQGNRVQQARRSDEAGRDPGIQHLDPGRRQDRRRSPSGRRT